MQDVAWLNGRRGVGRGWKGGMGQRVCKEIAHGEVYMSFEIVSAVLDYTCGRYGLPPSPLKSL